MVLAAGIWLCMLYTFQGLRMMIGIWIAVPPVCLVSVLIKLFRCKAEPQAPAVSVTRGQTITFSIRIKNRGLLPVAGVRADIRWHFRGAKDVRQRRWLRGISGRSGRKIEFEFQTAHCGRVEATVAKARMYDCLGLFLYPCAEVEASRFRSCRSIYPWVRTRWRELSVFSMRGATGEMGI